MLYKCVCGKIHVLKLDLYFDIIKHKEYCYCDIIEASQEA